MNKLLARSKSGLFASQSLSGYLIRGTIGFTLLYAAISQQHAYPMWSLLAGLLAFVAMRGCPLCWAIGLLASIHQCLARR